MLKNSIGVELGNAMFKEQGTLTYIERETDKQRETERETDSLIETIG